MQPSKWRLLVLAIALGIIVIPAYPEQKAEQPEESCSEASTQTSERGSNTTSAEPEPEAGEAPEYEEDDSRPSLLRHRGRSEVEDLPSSTAQQSREQQGKRPPRRASGRVLLPGGSAWKNQKRSTPQQPTPSSRATATGRSPVTEPRPGEQPPRRAAAPAEQAPPSLQQGVIYWTGKLQRNQVIAIEGRESTAGFADGDFLPGTPVEVRVLSAAIAIIQRPSGQNGWRRLAFRCLRTTQGTVTLNIQWQASQ